MQVVSLSLKRCKVIKFFIKHPTAANLMMCAFVLLGVMTLSKMKRESMPDFSTRTLEISAKYPGATAEEMEEAVAIPIEEALEGVDNIKRVMTTAMEGSVSIRVEITDGADYQEFQNDIDTEVNAIGSFPDELEDVLIKPHLDSKYKCDTFFYFFFSSKRQLRFLY